VDIYNGLGTAIKYLRRTASGAASSSLVTMIKFLRQTTNGAAGSGLGAMIKCLPRTTSAAAGSSLNRNRGWLMCPCTKSAPHSPCLCMLRSFANKHKKHCRSAGF
jgi:hypothetical protein